MLHMHWTILLSVLLNCSIFCPVHTYRLPVLEGFLCSDINHNDHYYHDPYSEMPRMSLVDKARAKTGMVYEKVDGRVRVWNRAGERFA